MPGSKNARYWRVKKSSTDLKPQMCGTSAEWEIQPCNEAWILGKVLLKAAPQKCFG